MPAQRLLVPVRVNIHQRLAPNAPGLLLHGKGHHPALLARGRRLHDMARVGPAQQLALGAVADDRRENAQQRLGELIVQVVRSVPDLTPF